MIGLFVLNQPIASILQRQNIMFNAMRDSGIKDSAEGRRMDLKLSVVSKY